MTINIHTLADDQIITEPGFYNISLDRHHDQPCMTPEAREALDEHGVLPPIEQISVTSGVLRTMELYSPADVWAFSRLNPHRWHKPETAALRLGRAMAAYIEGGDDQIEAEYSIRRDTDPLEPTANMRKTYAEEGYAQFDKRYARHPDDAPKQPLSSVQRNWKEGKPVPNKAACVYWDKISKSSKKWLDPKSYDKADEIRKRVEFWDAVAKDTRPPLSVKEFEMISDMGAVLRENPVGSALMSGEPEITMAYQDSRTGIWVLARPDVVNADGTVADYKKMNTAGGYFTHRHVDAKITEHGYDMQLALASSAMEALTGHWPEMAGIVAQWDRKPHHVITREILQEDVQIGRFRNDRAILRFAECYLSGDWPGPGDDIAAYMRPDWHREMILNEMNTEGKAP